MAAMGAILLAPTRRILQIVRPPVLMVYADDRNAMTDTEVDMNRVEAIWQQVEESTALVNN
eukprot:11808102-Alexandrium_andersonii.AAC.1